MKTNYYFVFVFLLLECFTFETFSQKVPHKVIVEKYLSGIVAAKYQVDPKTGVKNGSYRSWTANGVIESEGFYRMGKKTGAWKFYDEFGRVDDTENYKNDLMDGLCKKWCSDNNDKLYLCALRVYKNGEQISETLYDH